MSVESCGMCWRGPGSNSACAEHQEQYVKRLEREANTAQDKVANVFGLLGEIERLSPDAQLQARDVADMLDRALHPEVTR